ncbi:hypothetical protein [Pedobacter sp. Hv1]|nr:hypothetical protein [Pedobacter sp. Hv1]
MEDVTRQAILHFTSHLLHFDMEDGTGKMEDVARLTILHPTSYIHT